MIIGLPGSTFLIYFLAAVLPAAVLMWYIYQRDKVEKEPAGLLARCLIGGIFAALLAVALEEIGGAILNGLVAVENPFYVILLAFLVVAAAEEFAKYLFLKRTTWKRPEFDYRFDGIVYSVFVSLGFAAFENVSYVMGYGLSVAPARAVLSIPAHMGFAVFMGAFYGRARMFVNRENAKAAKVSIRLGLGSAIFLHGFYDACALSGSDFAGMLFLAFVVFLDIVMLRLIKKEADTDQPI